jgi:fermentation-respiration switch protein FrsA (DUF1100 family)
MTADGPMQFKKVPLFLAIAAACLSPMALSAQSSEESSLAGIWVGQLKVSAIQSLTIVVNITLDPQGKLGATLDSPDQGAKGIPVASVSIQGDALSLDSPAIKASYAGKLLSGARRIEGTFSQGGASLPLDLEKRDSAPVLLRPQEPKPPFPYSAEEVSIEGKAQGVRLAGTLVLPAGSGPFPAVVFATGSGAQDRNEELLGHKPFLVIADYLARRGVASLRFDDRGVGASTGDFASATTMDFADDVEAAFEFLAARPEVKAGSVGIIGHSEGGLIAPVIASRNPKVGFVVLLAGPGMRGLELLKLQGALIAKATGESAKAIAAGSAINDRLYRIAAGPGDESSVMAELKRAYLEEIAKNKSLKPEEKAQAEAGADEAVKQLASPWFRAFLGFDPLPYLKKVNVPMLALNGSKDLQVPPKENLGGIRKAQKGVGSPKSAYIELAGLNHLFQHAGTGSPAEYQKIEETFAPEALKAIGDWILSLR